MGNTSRSVEDEEWPEDEDEAFFWIKEGQRKTQEFEIEDACMDLHSTVLPYTTIQCCRETDLS